MSEYTEYNYWIIKYKGWVIKYLPKKAKGEEG